MDNLGFYTKAYTGDIAILCKGAFSSVVSDRMQSALNLILMW